MAGVDSIGDYPLIKIYLHVADEDDVTEDYRYALQKALILGIAELDEDGAFHPKAMITRGEAAAMASVAMNFAEKLRNPVVVDPIAAGDVTTAVYSAGEGISKIVLDMGERPHPGWGVKIEGIDFIDEDSAVVRYSVAYPDPAALYPMVITHPAAEAYIASKYTDITYSVVSVTNQVEQAPGEVDADADADAVK